MTKKLLFLYTEIAEYFLAGVEALSKLKAEIHIVRFPLNKEAPFKFRELPEVSFYNRPDYSEEQLLDLSKKINPDIIIVSGWIDKGYLKIAKYFKNKILTVLSLDNHWNGNLKQKIASILSPFYIKNKFTYAWVPGKPQSVFAKKLGFPESKIKTGFYTADVNLFSDYYQKYLSQKQKSYPKKILYVGRYIQQKGIFSMWQAFIELQKEDPSEWELICVGTGDLFDQRVEHPKIKHLGFIQPNQMGEIIADSGVYILPSNFEPWGVSVHEMAAAGMPLLCSKEVGAATEFLEDGKNGYFFEAENVESIKSAIKKIMQTDEKELQKMGTVSTEKASAITPEIWAQTVMSMLKYN